MINQNRTWKLRWNVLAIVAVLLLGAATLTDAQEKRTVAEIQADIAEKRQAVTEIRSDIGRLEIELREAKVAEGIEEDEDELTVVFYPIAPENVQLVARTAMRLLPSVQITFSTCDQMLSIIGTKADHDKVREIFAQLEKAQTPAPLVAQGAPSHNLFDRTEGRENVAASGLLRAQANPEPTVKVYNLSGLPVSAQMGHGIIGRSVYAPGKTDAWLSLGNSNGNLLLVHGSEAEHKIVAETIAKLRSTGDANADENPMLVRTYTLSIDFQVAHALIERLIPRTHETQNVRHEWNVSGGYKLILWARKSDHDRVAALFEQIEAEVRAAGEE
jgi:hypothetical protein